MDTQPTYVVLDRNRSERFVLAGPFTTREEAEQEASLWRGVTDPYVQEASNPLGLRRFSMHSAIGSALWEEHR